jgi:hypothetical protein
LGLLLILDLTTPSVPVMGALHNQISGALIYGPLFGHVWLEAMNKVEGWLARDSDLHGMALD